MSAGSRDHLCDRPAAVERHQHIPKRIPRRMKRDRERELRAERGEAADPGHDTGGGDGDVAGAEPEPAGVVERLDRGEDTIQVEEWLAHAHEHDVGESAPVGREPACRVANLVQDLGRLEIAGQPELTGRAEWAADRAPGLGRDAQRVSFAPTRRARIVHQHRLDERPVGQPMEGLLRCAAVGRDHVRGDDRVPQEGLTERRSQPRRQGQCLVRRPRTGSPHRVGDLAGAISGFRPLAEPALERGRLQAGQTGTCRLVAARAR
jgi:hypothetical protein